MKTIISLVFVLSQTLILAQGINHDYIQKALDKKVSKNEISGATISIRKNDTSFHFASGDLKVNDQYFLASITKMYTSAVIFKLEEENKLNLDDNINKYLHSEITDGLHIFEDVDYSGQITIKHLITHTSGLPDYFDENLKNEPSLFEYLKTEGDTVLSFNQMIEVTKLLEPKFEPGSKGKAFYSDINFQLLGRIIENITNKKLDLVFEEYIFKPLNLQKTYVYTNHNDTNPTPFNFKENKMNIPKMMTCFKPDGGIVSTSNESLIYLEAHLNGILFSKDYVDVNQNWNKIYYPLKYGLGMMLFKTFGVPEMIGHAGSSGSFAFYVPSKNMYIAGTINQVHRPQQVYFLLAKIISKID